MGFSVKLAPGVRIRASSRGVRASVGPRAARVHFGSGRTGVSTGIGPVGFYSSLGGGRSGGRSSRAGTSVASYQRQVAAQQRQAVQAERAQLARAVADTFQRILTLHRMEFAAAGRPSVPAPQPPDRTAIYRHYEQLALNGVSVFRRAKRVEARQRAAAWADGEVQRQWSEACLSHAQQQEYFDRRWDELCVNKPDIVIETLDEAFEDNEAPAAAVGVSGDDVALVVLVPPMAEAIPEHMPTTTQSGNLSMKKLTQRDRSDYYKIFVCGQVLVTVRETLAVAPGLGSATVVVVRNEGKDAYGKTRVSCILAARFQRATLSGVQWATADASTIVNDVSVDRVINQKGRSQELAPLDLAGVPGLADLIKAVDLDELTG